MPEILIGCSSYNHEKFVLDFLDCLLSQMCSEWDLIIVDDCSMEQTSEKIKYLVGILVLAFAVCLSYIVLR